MADTSKPSPPHFLRVPQVGIEGDSLRVYPSVYSPRRVRPLLDQVERMVEPQVHVQGAIAKGHELDVIPKFGRQLAKEEVGCLLRRSLGSAGRRTRERMPRVSLRLPPQKHATKPIIAPLPRTASSMISTPRNNTQPEKVRDAVDFGDGQK